MFADVRGQAQADRMRKRNRPLFPALGQGEHLHAVDEPHLTPHMHDPTQEVDVVDADTKQLTLTLPTPGPQEHHRLATRRHLRRHRHDLRQAQGTALVACTRGRRTEPASNGFLATIPSSIAALKIVLTQPVIPLIVDADSWPSRLLIHCWISDGRLASAPMDTSPIRGYTCTLSRRCDLHHRRRVTCERLPQLFSVGAQRALAPDEAGHDRDSAHRPLRDVRRLIHVEHRPNHPSSVERMFGYIQRDGGADVSTAQPRRSRRPGGAVRCLTSRGSGRTR
ncbi:MAG TPA: hypothetical protein VK585_04815 [Jiangellaceae bacterium]|nr:hypothetical protein [Jiangellaceae bacterium]